MATYFRSFQYIRSKYFIYKLKTCIIRLRKSNNNVYLKSFCTSPKLHIVSLLFFPGSVINLNFDSTKSNNDLRDEHIISYYISLAETAIKEGDYDKAENILQKALNVSDKIMTVGVTCIYDMLATIAYKKGNTAEATNRLEEVIAKLSESNSKEDKNMVINFSLKLARLYENEGRFDLAELGYRNCITIQKTKYLKGAQDEETTTLWINSLFWYGKFLAQRTRYSEAKQCFESVYQLIPHVKSIGNDQAMVTLFNMGEMCFATGDDESALKHLLNAVLLGKTLKSSELPIYYNKIGLIYLYKGIYNEARRWCENGLESSKRNHNKTIKKESEDCLKEIERLFFKKTNNKSDDIHKNINENK